MHRRILLAAAPVLVLAACAPAPQLHLGPDGKPLVRRYDIAPGDTAKIQYRMLDSVNTLRRTAGIAPLALDPQLTAAAATHSRDMSVQNRPWHFGSDGSSPLDRVRRTGYPGMLIGENISETYENEVETLAAWMNEIDTRSVVMDPAARNMGFAWYQEPTGKLWWTMVTGS